MWQRAAVAWAVATCGCSFEALVIRLAPRDAVAKESSAEDVAMDEPSSADAAADAPPPDGGLDASLPDAPPDAPLPDESVDTPALEEAFNADATADAPPPDNARDAALPDVASDFSSADAPPDARALDAAAHDAPADAIISDASSDLQRSCVPPVSGCGQARIAGGTFAMGDPSAFDFRGMGQRAVPVQSSITVSAFMLDRYEVTVARFRVFARMAGLAAGSGFNDRVSNPGCNWTAMPADREGHPMNCVDWQTAQNFCQWDVSGGALPTEAQWEYAARGATSRPWPWEGPDSTAPDGRVCWNRYSPTPLGTCPEEASAYAAGATPDGVWHLVGNVWEWTADWYAPYTDTTCWNGPARMNPTCTTVGMGYRSGRGGGWSDGGPPGVRSGARYGYRPPSVAIDVGFRCAGTVR